MEQRASIVVVLGCGWAILRHIPLTTVNALYVLAGGVILQMLECKTHSATKNHKSEDQKALYRVDAGHAYYCCILLPVAVSLSALHLSDWLYQNVRQSEESNENHGCKMLILYSMFLAFTMLAVEIHDANKEHPRGRSLQNADTTFTKGSSVMKLEWISGATGTAVGLVLLVVAFYCINYTLMYVIGCWEICILGAFSLLGVALRTCCLQWLPGSFSPGEATVVAHGLSYLLLVILKSAVSKWIPDEPLPVHISYSSDVVIFMQTAVVSCLLVTWCLYSYPSTRHPFLYYPLVLAVMGVFALPLLYFYISDNFVLWIIKYVTLKPARKYLFAYWTLSSIIAGIIVTVNSNRLVSLDSQKKLSETKDESLQRTACSQDILEQKQSVVTVARKHFHVFAVCVFVPGLIWDREMLCNGATCAMVVFVMLEGLRIPKIPPFGSLLDEYFQVLVDDRDAGPVILTHMYLLAGLALPLWLHLTPLDSGALLPLLSGVLSLGVGDTAASVFGSKLGRHRWPGTKKTVEGTFAAVLFQLIGVAVLYWLELPIRGSWIQILLAVVMTSLLEAFTSQIDNLTLPLFMYIMLV